MDLISRQAAIAIIHSLYPSAPIMRINRKRWEKKYKPYIEVEKALEQLPYAQPEQSRVKNSDLRDIEKLVASVSEEQNYDIAMEECAELIQAVSKFRRDENPKTRQNLVEELADVLICIEMVQVLANIDEGSMTDMIYHKMQRNLKRIERGV